MARPKSFDPDEVLVRAMDCFWDKGYEETSVRDLVERMGVNRFSLYSTFGDKRDLFVASLDLYCKQVVEPRLVEMETGERGLGDIEDFLSELIDGVVESSSRRGCLMILAAVMELDDEASARRVREYLERVAGAFEKVLRRARDLGELREGVGVAQGARALVMMMQGLGVVCRVSPNKRMLRSSVAVVLDGLRGGEQ